MNIGIIGLGLMGGSIALSLKGQHNIYAFDISRESLQYALDNGVIDQAYFDLEKLLAQIDIAFLCVYPKACANFILENQSKFKADTIIIEISGIKSGLVNEVIPLLRKDIDLVFTHPIAGREKIGIYHSQKSIFENQNYVIVPTKKNKKESLQIATTLAMQMGFKNVSYLTAEEHDEIIAYTSQLAHVLALALMESDSQKYDTAKLIGDSFRDLTRISMINEALWSELLIENKEYLLPQIDKMIESIGKYRTVIEAKDVESLTNLMRKAKEMRLALEKEVAE